MAEDTNKVLTEQDAEKEDEAFFDDQFAATNDVITKSDQTKKSDDEDDNG